MRGYGIHMTTTTYRNDITGYRVTLVDNGKGARVTDSLGYDFPMVGADYPHAKTLAASRAHLNGAAPVGCADCDAPAVAESQGHGMPEGQTGPKCSRHSQPRDLWSPLPAELQVRSARPLAAGVIGLPSLPQARCLNWSVGDDAAMPIRPVVRGFASVDGRTAPMPVLIAMARRGWLELDHPIRPSYGRATKAGHLALLAYVTKHGEVQ